MITITLHRNRPKGKAVTGILALDLAGMTYVDTLFNQLDVYYDDEKVQIEIIDADAPAA